MRVMPDHELFKFGRSNSPVSMHRVGVGFAVFHKFIGRVWFSVVDGDCQPLSSKFNMNIFGF